MSMRLATRSMMVSCFLAAMDLKGLRHSLAQRGDPRAFVFRIARVEHQHGDVFLDRGENGCRVQHLGAEVGELGGFFKADGLDAQRIGADAGVGRHDAVDVGPDLDGFGIHASADEGGGVVGSAAAEGGGDAIDGRPDEAAHDGHFVVVDQRLQMLAGGGLRSAR